MESEYRMFKENHSRIFMEVKKYCNLHDGDREGNRVPILEVSAENSPGNSDSSYPFKSMF